MSLDVASLYTNVSLMETVEYICEQLRELEIETTIPLGIVKEILPNCTMNVNFKLNGEIYRRLDGFALGSLLGLILADIFLTKLENGTMARLIDKCSFSCRHMDDTL